MTENASTDGAEAEQGLFGLLGRFEFRLAQAFIALMTVLVLASAITRTVGRPASWTVDLATFTFAWAVFLGADVAWRRSNMVSINLVVDRLPERVRAWVGLVNLVLIAGFLAAMVWTGAMLVRTAQDRGLSGLPGLSYAWVTAAVPVGCLLMLLTTVVKMRSTLAEARGATTA